MSRIGQSGKSSNTILRQMFAFLPKDQMKANIAAINFILPTYLYSVVHPARISIISPSKGRKWTRR